jgi:hypothetical protein
MSSNNPGLAELVFDWNQEKEIAENIYHAQNAGWPSTLTYDFKNDETTRKQQRAWRRDAAMNTLGEEVPQLLSRDEYPFACTKEHHGTVWVGHVPPVQNSRQGGKVSAFLKAHGATDGFRFSVKVINVPLPVK